VSLKRVFAFTAEPAMRDYLTTVSHSLDGLVSLVADRKAIDGAAAEEALNWTLRRKSIILETLYQFREAQSLFEREPATAMRVAQWRGLRQRLTNLTLSPPKDSDLAAQEREKAALRAQSEGLEAELHQILSQHRREPLTSSVDTKAVRQRLPVGAAP